MAGGLVGLHRRAFRRNHELLGFQRRFFQLEVHGCGEVRLDTHVRLGNGIVPDHRGHERKVARVDREEQIVSVRI